MSIKTGRPINITNGDNKTTKIVVNKKAIRRKSTIKNIAVNHDQILVIISFILNKFILSHPFYSYIFYTFFNW